MSVENKVLKTLQAGEGFDLTISIREVAYEGETSYLAECLEMPGCVSDGETSDEALANIKNAIGLCLSVIVEDALRKMPARQTVFEPCSSVRERRMHVHPLHELEYA